MDNCPKIAVHKAWDRLACDTSEEHAFADSLPSVKQKSEGLHEFLALLAWYEIQTKDEDKQLATYRDKRKQRQAAITHEGRKQRPTAITQI